ncbi:MAG: nitrate reductase cytochrome c-type subunit [Acidobacteria bacterium]|nr:nitrate reductase cytochrome c-type subunit [Acidobacteriota bacterium]
MRRIPTFGLLLALAGVPALAGAQAAAPAPAAPATATSPAPAADGAAAVYDHGDKRPGQSARFPREWEGAPALIPHALKGLTPVTAKRNACIGCHGRAGATTGPPAAPASHFTTATGDAAATAKPQLASSRWNCTACHVPQTNAPPLVAPASVTGR